MNTYVKLAYEVSRVLRNINSDQCSFLFLDLRGQQYEENVKWLSFTFGFHTSYDMYSAILRSSLH